MRIAGLLFDKDGTLFDFQATWGAFAEGLIVEEARGDAELADRMADVLGFDRGAQRFRQGSIVIAETTETVARALAPVLGRADPGALAAEMNARSARVPQVPVTMLSDLFRRLRGAGLALGVATNDSEAAALRHVADHGLAGLVDFVAGYDSGHGSKPAPGPCLAFARGARLDPGRVAMIGDSLHDLEAGRAAGMMTVGVLTGPALERDLRPHADVVLGSIADLPDWLGLPKATPEGRN